MEIFEDEEVEISSKPHAVYKTGGKTNISYAVTIPKAFAHEMGITGKKKAYVMIRLIKENDHDKKSSSSKKVYCIIEKLE